MDRHAKSALRKELQRAEDERDRLDVVIAYLRERLREDDESIPAPNSADAPSTKTPTRSATARGGQRRMTAAVAAERVLREKGEPIRTPDLLVAVQALGAKMKDSDGLYRTLLRQPKFRRDGRGLWALAEWPSPGQLTTEERDMR